jgi:hypothetical protein
MQDDLLPTQEPHPAPSKAAVAEQAEEILRLPVRIPTPKPGRSACASQPGNFEAGSTTS